jgi:hypothetical protein
MGSRVVQFLTVVLTALALIPAGAHRFELRNKIDLPRDAYQTVQGVYAGWALFGVIDIPGAYKENGVHTAPSNEAFDRDLKGRNLEWGVLDLEAVANLASSHGLELVEHSPMPANNLSVVFRRQQLDASSPGCGQP